MYIIKIANARFNPALQVNLESGSWFGRRCFAAGSYDSGPPHQTGGWVEFEIRHKEVPGVLKKLSEVCDGTFCAGLRYVKK